MCRVLANTCKTAGKLNLKYHGLRQSWFDFEFSFKGEKKLSHSSKFEISILVGLWIIPPTHYDYSFQTWFTSPERIVQRHLLIGRGWVDFSQAAKKSLGYDCVHLGLYWTRWKLGFVISSVTFLVAVWLIIIKLGNFFYLVLYPNRITYYIKHSTVSIKLMLLLFVVAICKAYSLLLQGLETVEF